MLSNMDTIFNAFPPDNLDHRFSTGGTCTSSAMQKIPVTDKNECLWCHLVEPIVSKGFPLSSVYSEFNSE